MDKKNNLIITGLPRSGTSFLCSRINEVPNTAIINEPAEVFRELKGGNKDGLARLFTQYRNDIGLGKPVYNKIKEGKFIEDTRLEDSRSLHTHIVDDDNFMLGIKNTLVFLAMLSMLVQYKPRMKIIASIRHPYDCIGSWKGVSFPHLQNGKPDFLTDYATGPFAVKLPKVLKEEEVDLRLAMLWQLLAQTIMSLKDKIHVVRYEDIVMKPDKAYKDICKYLQLEASAVKEIPVSKPVKRRGSLSEPQMDIIANICNKTAMQFGYRTK